MITHELVLPSSLRPGDRDRMLCLMQAYYLGVAEEDFSNDLGEKNGVILLRDAVGRIVGFSTITSLDLHLDVPVKAIFSGDTIVSSEHRQNVGLAIELARYFRQALLSHPGTEVYYVLISKGWRTARIPSLCFRESFPSPDRPTSVRAQQVIDAFGQTKYPGRYDSRRGTIVGGSPASQRLKPGSPEAVVPDRHDPSLAFFVERNPAFLAGDELIFVARVSPANFTQGFRRLFETRAEVSSVGLA